MVWSELAAAFPGSGGTYHFYDAAYGVSRVGRMLKFLFVWQFFFSGPLEIATGAIGLVKYLGYFFPALDVPVWNWKTIIGGADVPVIWGQIAAMGVMVIVTVLAYRRISVAGRLMVILWAGMLLTVLWVIVAAASRFDARVAFDFPAGAFRIDSRMVMGLGLALAIAMYDFFGYYQVCYLGDEVADAPRTIPRLDHHLGARCGSLVPGDEHRDSGCRSVARHDRLETHRQRLDGDCLRPSLRPLGSRGRNDADCLDGAGFGVCGDARLQPDSVCISKGRAVLPSVRQAPSHRAFSAPVVDFDRRPGGARVPGRTENGDRCARGRGIPIQFVGQIATVFYLRWKWKERRGTFRMPFFPLPALVALTGWVFIFVTSERVVIVYSLATLIAGVAAFFLWDLASRGPKGSRAKDGSLASGWGTE